MRSTILMAKLISHLLKNLLQGMMKDQKLTYTQLLVEAPLIISASKIALQIFQKPLQALLKGKRP
jgi:hypothetical protein